MFPVSIHSSAHINREFFVFILGTVSFVLRAPTKKNFYQKKIFKIFACLFDYYFVINQWPNGKFLLSFSLGHCIGGHMPEAFVKKKF